jgi:hypothetical protein
MPNLFKIEHNTETGKITKTDLTADELAELQAKATAVQLEQAAEQAKAADSATAKAALLARLGITADEAKLLLG